MGCPSHVVIGDNLVFSITCHDADTGVLTDADSAPAYRVYEDETATAILTGTMAKLDDGNTTGFYPELIACTTAAGFEEGKSYTIYIEATVDSDTGGICYGFKAITKTGYSLAATGLDAIATTEPTTVATTWPGMVVQIFRRLFGKVTQTSTQLKTYHTEGETIVTTLALSDESGTLTQGEAS